MSRQFAVAINRTSLLRALTILEEQTQNKTFAAVLDQGSCRRGRRLVSLGCDGLAP